MSEPNIRIVDLCDAGPTAVEQTAALLFEVFAVLSPGSWPDMASAREEVRESLTPGWISRVALDGEGDVVGWIGGCPRYEGHVWELHPLVVRPDRQRQGIGRALVADLEALVRARGAQTLWLGADDEDESTTLGGVELYPDPLAHLARIRNLGGHQYAFYQKVGFVIVGVMPDANGWGKPDIYMAKRL
jgi:aminoglycoside 6'-N-acetyltransferase I